MEIEAKSLYMTALGCTIESDPHGADRTLGNPLEKVSGWRKYRNERKRARAFQNTPGYHIYFLAGKKDV